MALSAVSGLSWAWWPAGPAASPALRWLWMAVWLLGATSQRIYREDQLALLSGTLRTFQVASCDGELLRLECPAGTTVSIQLVQYGRLATNPELCGSPADMRHFNYTDCMDRSALKVVIDACGGKRQCQLRTSAALFGVDPCPGISKFVEVAYKCRPTEFRTKVVCQGQQRRIHCDQHRVAIYSATFGTRRQGTVHCPQPPGIRLTDCHSSLTSEKMISWCQGKPSCELSADPELFERPCPGDHNMYLTTKYTCVPKEILKERYATQVDEDYQQNMTEAPSAELEEPVEPSEMEARDVPSVDENGQERLILYLTLGITVCLLLCLGVLVGRLCVRRKTKQFGREPPPPGFGSDSGTLDSHEQRSERTALSSGRMTPPHAVRSDYGPPPGLMTNELTRQSVPYRERDSRSPARPRAAPGDTLRGRQANFDIGRDGVPTMNCGSEFLRRNAPSASSPLRDDHLIGREHDLESDFGGRLRPADREVAFLPRGEFSTFAAHSDPMDGLMSSGTDSHRSLGAPPRSPYRTIGDPLYPR